MTINKMKLKNKMDGRLLLLMAGWILFAMLGPSRSFAQCTDVNFDFGLGETFVFEEPDLKNLVFYVLLPL